MKQPSNKDSRLEDDDIASLFAAQNVSVPIELKRSVLEQAQRQLHADAEKDTDIALTDNHSTHDHDLPRNSHAPEAMQTQGFHARSRWFAVAATVLVAVVVTPLVLNTPDSSLSRRGITTNEFDSVASSATAEPETAEPETAEPETAAAPFAATQAARSAASSTSMSLMKQRSSNGVSGDAADDGDPGGDISSDVSSGTSDGGISNGLIAHRQTSDLWVKEIQRLINQKDYTLARSEYRLFEKQHPERARDFKPDFQSLDK